MVGVAVRWEGADMIGWRKKGVVYARKGKQEKSVEVF